MNKLLSRQTQILLDDTTMLSLAELAYICHVPDEFLIEFVEHGLLEPIGNSPKQWQFTAVSITRCKTVLHLKNDLGVNTAGAALVLDLLDELRQLRTKVKLLKQ